MKKSIIVRLVFGLYSSSCSLIHGEDVEDEMKEHVFPELGNPLFLRIMAMFLYGTLLLILILQVLLA